MNGKEDSADESIPPFKHGIAEYEYNGAHYLGDNAQADADAAYQKDRDALTSKRSKPTKADRDTPEG
jgi:hypothetical protein